MKQKNIYKLALFLLALIVLSAPFVFVKEFADILEGYAHSHPFSGSFAYIFLLAASVVIAPFSMPLFLVAGGIWGPALTASFNVVGWGIGAAVAFSVAREIGKPLLARFVSFGKIEAYEKNIPLRAEFWSIVALRVVMPVDALSYALGFFSTISFPRYMLATIIGITPFSIVFAYGGEALLDGRYLVAVAFAVLAGASSLIGLSLFRKR